MFFVVQLCILKPCIWITSTLNLKIEVGIDKKILQQEMMVLQRENSYFGIYYSIAQWATLAYYKLLNA